MVISINSHGPLGFVQTPEMRYRYHHKDFGGLGRAKKPLRRTLLSVKILSAKE